MPVFMAEFESFCSTWDDFPWNGPIVYICFSVCTYHRWTPPWRADHHITGGCRGDRSIEVAGQPSSHWCILWEG